MMMPMNQKMTLSNLMMNLMTLKKKMEKTTMMMKTRMRLPLL